MRLMLEILRRYSYSPPLNPSYLLNDNASSIELSGYDTSKPSSSPRQIPMLNVQCPKPGGNRSSRHVNHGYTATVRRPLSTSGQYSSPRLLRLVRAMTLKATLFLAETMRARGLDNRDKVQDWWQLVTGFRRGAGYEEGGAYTKRPGFGLYYSGEYRDIPYTLEICGKDGFFYLVFNFQYRVSGFYLPEAGRERRLSKRTI